MREVYQLYHKVHRIQANKAITSDIYHHIILGKQAYITLCVHDKPSLIIAYMFAILFYK